MDNGLLVGVKFKLSKKPKRLKYEILFMDFISLW